MGIQKLWAVGKRRKAPETPRIRRLCSGRDRRVMLHLRPWAKAAYAESGGFVRRGFGLKTESIKRPNVVIDAPAQVFQMIAVRCTGESVPGGGYARSLKTASLMLYGIRLTATTHLCSEADDKQLDVGR